MAETSTGSKNSLGFLTKKAGPFPVWLWAAAAVGVWYWYTHYGPGASKQAAAGAQAVDPATGVSYEQELQEAEDAQASLTQPGPTDVNITVTDQDQKTPTRNPPPPVRQPPPKPKKNVRVPKVAGKRAAFAISDIEAVGLEAKTNPLRKPVDEYVATGTRPPAGSSVPEGSQVTIEVRESAAPKTRWREQSGGPIVLAPAPRRHVATRPQRKVAA